MLSSKGLKEIVTAVRPIIERQLDDAEQIAAFRDKVSDAGGDWSALKALIKAQIQDERDETGEGKRVKKILDKAGFSTDYADLLGWSNMNEKNFISEPASREERRRQIMSEDMADHKALIDVLADDGLISEEARQENKALADAVANKFGAGAKGASAAPLRSDGGTRIVHKHTNIKGLPETAQHEPELSRPAPMAVSGGEPSIPSSDDGGEKTDGYSHPGRSDDKSAYNLAELEQATTDQPLAGGNHVDDSTSHAAHGPGLVGKSPATFILRPHCLRPTACAGHGSNHCHACKKAIAENRELEPA